MYNVLAVRALRNVEWVEFTCLFSSGNVYALQFSDAFYLDCAEIKMSSEFKNIFLSIKERVIAEFKAAFSNYVIVSVS